MHDDPRNDASDPAELTQRHAVPPVDPAAVERPGRAVRITVEPTPTPSSRNPPPRRGPRLRPRRRPAATATRRPPSRAPTGPVLGPGHARHPRALVRAGADAGPHRAGHGRAVARGESAGRWSRPRSCPRSSPRAARSSPSAPSAPSIDRPPRSTSPAATNAGAVQPVAIDESSATIAVASTVSPAVVKIRVTGAADTGNLGVIPATGVGSGVIFDSNGWILTNHHVVEGGEKFDVELKDGRVLQGTRLRHRHAHRPGHRQGRRDGPADAPRSASRTRSRSASWSSPSAARSGPTRTRSPAGSCRPRAARSRPTAASSSPT